MAAEPKRILHIITRMIVGGAQEQTLLAAAHFNSPPFKTHILCGPQTGPEGSLHEACREADVPLTIETSLVREIHPLRDLQALRRLTDFIRQHKFDVVHTHSSKAGILGRMAALQARCPNIIHTVHGWGFHTGQSTWKNKLFIQLERHAATYTHTLITVSNEDQKAGLQFGIGRPEQYQTIRSAIDFSQFKLDREAGLRIRNALGIAQDTPIVGSVTRLSPQKDPMTLCRVIHAVNKTRPDVHWIIVGDGPLRQDVEQFLVQHELSSRVTLTGVRRDIPDLMNAFDLFLLTSRWEGLPRVLPQALGCGCPVIATDAGGSRDLIQHNVTGLITPMGDPESTADQIISLLNQPDEAERLAEAGQALAFQEFDIQDMFHKLRTVYEQAITS